MKSVDPAELSALIDGELSPERAAEVRQAIETDEALRRQYQRLLMLDAELKTEAQSALFRPRVTLPQPSRVSWLPLIPLVLLLVALRILFKVLPSLPEIGLETAALIVIVGGVLRRLLVSAQEEGRRLCRELARSSG